mgnify:FL=1|jgi:hypothetical protein
MLKFNKIKKLNSKYKNNTPLLPSNSKGEINKLKPNVISEKKRIKEIQDLNGMQITYDAIKQKN